MAQSVPVNKWVSSSNTNCSISNPNKCGDPPNDSELSKEIEIATAGTVLSKKQIWIERIIHKVFKEHGIPMECITDDLRSRFKTKLWRMGKALSRMGGPKIKQQLHRWKGECWLMHTD
jgi:hypothetical protein